MLGAGDLKDGLLHRHSYQAATGLSVCQAGTEGRVFLSTLEGSKSGQTFFGTQRTSQGASCSTDAAKISRVLDLLGRASCRGRTRLVREPPDERRYMRVPLPTDRRYSKIRTTTP